MKKPGRWKKWMGWGIILGLLTGGQSQAADLMERVKNQEITQSLRLRAGSSKVLQTPFAITRISVGDPEVADILLVSEKEIYVNGLAPGVTNLSIWGKSRFSSASVTVEADLTLLKEKLHQILPKEKIGAEAAGDSIVLSGEVSGPVAQDTAISLALPYAGGKKEKVINLLHIGGVQQVMVEVRLAEINRIVAERIGVNFAAINSNGSFGVTQIDNLGSISNLIRTIAPAGFPGSGSSGTGGTAYTQGMATTLTAIGGFTAGSALITTFLDLLKQKNLGRVLAEPNLVATSGQKASFLAGGEYPIPVPQSGIGGAATITIEYKKYGVQLEFTPTVLNDSKIALKVHPVVSELDYTTQPYVTSGYVVPGLRTREMDTHVEVKDGQTFAIAGLLSDTSRNIISKFPVLGDLPILGVLFRSVNYQRNETELVALVTPHLVKPIAPGKSRLPTDKYVEPTEYELYLLGLDQGRQKPKQGPPPTSKATSVGSLPPGFGHQPVN